MGQGGTIVYGTDQLGAVKIAITEFSKVTDTNATLLPSFSYSSGEVCSSISYSSEAEIMTSLQVIPTIIMFYNAPQPPFGIFDTFLQLPNQQKDVQARSYANLVSIQATSTTSPVGLR